MDSLAAIAVPVLTAIATAVTALFLLRTQRRKLGAEADSIIVGAAGKLVENLQAEIERLAARVAELEAQRQADRAELVTLRCEVDRMTAENTRLKRRVTELEAENRRLGGRPAEPQEPV